MNVGDGIEKDNGCWSFADGVAPLFADHARKSIPGYDSGHNLIAKMANHFLGPGSRCIDVGCSTGELLNLLWRAHGHKSPELIGIDIEPEMIAAAQEKSAVPAIIFEKADALHQTYENCDMVCLYYVLQFVKPKVRQDLLDKIWMEMNWGGGLFLFEKVRGADARFQDIMTAAYWDFKFDNGFSDKEVIGKWRSLQGVLEPFSEQGNLGLLRRAGWKDIETIWRWGPFQGFLAIK